jgi:hypothetical protein
MSCAPEDWFWAAWALSDAALSATATGRAGKLVAALSRAPFPTLWTRAAVAHARGELEEASAIYRRMGARPEEAEVWLMAGPSSAQHAHAVRFRESVGAAAQLDAAALPGAGKSP